MNTPDKLLESLKTGFATPLEPVVGPFPLESYPDGGVPAEQTVSALFQCGGDGVVRTAAYDSHLANRTRQNNERTWTLGDVIEFFVQAPGHDDYFEFHVTPQARTLQLHLPDYRTLRAQTFESMLCDAGLVVSSRREGEVWLTELRVPLVKLGAQTVDGLRFAVCRYNYGPVGKPELSSYPALDDSRGFHNPPAWAQATVTTQGS